MLKSKGRKSVTIKNPSSKEKTIVINGSNYKTCMLEEWLDSNDNLVYYSFTHTHGVNIFKQELSYNHIAKRVDYRDSGGTKWQKVYNNSGFEIILSVDNKKTYYNLNTDTMKVTKVDSNKKVVELDHDIKNKQIIDGIDYEDRFLIENTDLLLFFANGRSTKEILKYIDLYGGNEVLNKLSSIYNK